jgi:hypothetical protein
MNETPLQDQIRVYSEALVKDLPSQPTWIADAGASAASQPAKSWRGWAVAATTAVLTIVLLGSVALRSPFDDSSAPGTEPPVATIPEEPATASTTVTNEPGESVGPVVGDDALAFDEVLDDERMAAGPTISIGPDGLPVIWYWSEDPEVYFGDGIGSRGGVRIVRCAEATCGDFEVINASPDFPVLPPEVFLPDGAMIFVEAGGLPGATEATGMLDGLATLHVCADAFCSEAETTVLETVDYPDLILNVPQVLVGDRGLPVLIFQSDAPPAVNSIKIMVCEDRACTASTVTTLIDEARGPQAYVAEDGGLVLLHQDLANGWLAVTCAELDCSDGATTVTIDDALGLIPRDTRPILSRGWPDDDNLEVCFGPACIAIEGVGGGESEAIVGADGLLLLVWAPTGSQPDYGHLLVTKCADTSCSEHTTVKVASLISDGDLALGRFVVGVGPSVAIGDRGLPLIAYGTIDGLHLIRCPDAACTPPDG